MRHSPEFEPDTANHDSNRINYVTAKLTRLHTVMAFYSIAGVRRFLDRLWSSVIDAIRPLASKL